MQYSEGDDYALCNEVFASQYFAGEEEVLAWRAWEEEGAEERTSKLPVATLQYHTIPHDITQYLIVSHNTTQNYAEKAVTIQNNAPFSTSLNISTDSAFMTG